jgi:hypothetical protein
MIPEDFNNWIAELSDKEFKKFYKQIKLYRDIRKSNKEIREGKTLTIDELFLGSEPLFRG